MYICFDCVYGLYCVWATSLLHLQVCSHIFVSVLCVTAGLLIPDPPTLFKKNLNSVLVCNHLKVLWPSAFKTIISGPRD